MTGAPRSGVLRHRGDYRWEGVEVRAYKAEGGTHFRDVTRQQLFGGGEGASELRYFELQPEGHTTLERHAHTHEVMILRGRGRVLVGDAIHDVAPLDLVKVAPHTWHQFRADAGETLGFLCLVDRERDRPQRPTPGELDALRADPAIAEFIRT